MLEVCHGSSCHRHRSYSGEVSSLGNYLMKRALEAYADCPSCKGPHVDRFYFGEYSVTVSL